MENIDNKIQKEVPDSTMELEDNDGKHVESQNIKSQEVPIAGENEELLPTTLLKETEIEQTSVVEINENVTPVAVKDIADTESQEGISARKPTENDAESKQEPMLEENVVEAEKVDTTTVAESEHKNTDAPAAQENCEDAMPGSISKSSTAQSMETFDQTVTTPIAAEEAIEPILETALEKRLNIPEQMDTVADEHEKCSDAAETNAEQTEQTNGTKVVVQSVEIIAKATEHANAESPIEMEAEKSNTSGLSLLAQYNSDNESTEEDAADESDQESVIEVPVTNSNKNYRDKVVTVDSSSDSDSSSSDSDVECLTKLREKINKAMEVDDDDDEHEDDGNTDTKKTQKRQQPKVKGEMTLDDLPPIHELQITVPEDECIELGKIHSIVDQLVLVNALPDAVLVDLDTVLFLDKGKRVLGEVFDVLGQVADPLYCVRFNSNDHVKEKGINVGDIVFVAPKTQYTQFVILSSLMNMRGSDASWENDVEPPPRFLDYSDDEEEREARHKLRKQNRPNDKNNDEAKRARPDETNVNTTSMPNQRNARQRNNYGHNNESYGSRETSPYNTNRNTSSWHSNYRHQTHFGRRAAAPPSNYAHYMPPPAPPHHYGNYQHNMYPPYGAPPMPQAHPSHMPPQYVMNPYSVRPPVLPPAPFHQHSMSSPPPPPPGET